MKRVFLLTAVILITTISIAQELRPVDSSRIAYLKGKLATAKGTREADLLNDIAWEYTWAGKDKEPAGLYGEKALEKSRKLNYQKGIGYAAITLSWYYQVKNPQLADSLLTAAFSIGNKLKDARMLGWAYHKQWEMKKAIEYFRKAGDLEGEAEATTWLCYDFGNDREYKEEGFAYCQRAVELAKRRWTHNIGWGTYLSQFSYEIMSWLYTKVGDYSTALSLLNKANQMERVSGYDVNASLAELYTKMGRPDSALMLLEKLHNKYPENPWMMESLAEAYIQKGESEKATPLLKESINRFSKRNVESAGKSYLLLGKIAFVKKDLAEALNKTRTGYDLSLKLNNRARMVENMKEGSKQLSEIYEAKGDYQSALNFLQQYNKLKDSLDNSNNMWRLSMQLSNYKKAADDQKRTSQLQLLHKENQLKEAKLKQERFMKNGLAVGLALILLTGFFTFRTLYFKRKAERLRREQLENEMTVKELKSRQEQAELQRKSGELEMQALRAQMNPHFIFNCLSSINRFVLKNETETASDYLTRFSRLIRLVLINSQKTVITLEDELEMLRLYLDMERLRFKNAFDFNITFANSIEEGNVMVPPLLLQPFCENAIWHGLMHKEGQGKLDIVLSMEGNILNCTITDNGIGRTKAAEMNNQSGTKGKSLGLKITSDRLALLNAGKEIDTSYKIEDLYENEIPAGTRVSVQISCNEISEETDPIIKAATK